MNSIGVDTAMDSIGVSSPLRSQLSKEDRMSDENKSMMSSQKKSMKKYSSK